MILAPPARFLLLEELLVLEELSALQEHVSAREGDFARSGVMAGADPAYRDYRRSRVLLDTGPFHALFAARIAFYFRRILAALGHAPFAMTRVESQITESNDGDYFRVHDDSTGGCPTSREVSYVYFFHREPKRFEGGELVLYDAAEPPVEVVPRQNAVVFFESARLHEVKPVVCPSRRFGDGRLTLNGWIHR